MCSLSYPTTYAYCVRISTASFIAGSNNGYQDFAAVAEIELREITGTNEDQTGFQVCSVYQGGGEEILS